MSAFLSGEMKDTVQINPAGAYGMTAPRSHPSLWAAAHRFSLVLERFFSRKERQKLFRSWPGSASMWIKVSCHPPRCMHPNYCKSRLNMQGGDDVWGNATWAPDDVPNSTHTHGALIAFRNASSALDGDMEPNNMTSSEAGTWILERTPTTFQVRTTFQGNHLSDEISRPTENVGD